MQRTIGRFLETVRRTVRDHDMLAPDAHVLVALSGGADSAAALAALAQLASRARIVVSAAHIHHGLRGAEADADVVVARRLATHFGAVFHLARVPASLRQGGNLEARAREARYCALATIARRCGATRIATGHTLNDQAETVLLRLVRGCGPSGLTAILPVMGVDGVRVIRPLLGCTRADVEGFVAALGLSYCTDSSNHDPRFLRNRIRLEVLPMLRKLNPQIDRALADLATMSQEREAAMTSSTVSAPVTLTVSGLRAMPAARRPDTVRQWLATVRGSRGLTKRHLISVLTLIEGRRPSRRIELPGGAVLREYDRLEWATAPENSSSSATLKPRRMDPGRSIAMDGWRIESSRIEPVRDQLRPPTDLWSALVDGETAAGGLTIRNPEPGDRVQPYGMSGRRKLSDIFVDRKVPRALRSRYPVVQAGADILWVPGVVRSRIGLAGEQSRHVLWLHAKSAPKPLLG